MAASASVSALRGRCASPAPQSFLPRPGLAAGPLLLPSLRRRQAGSARPAVAVRAAAKLPAGVQAPKEQPKLPTPLWGFTENAEVWNSRAAMIGFFALLLLEWVTGRGILEMVGVEIGKGLDLPI